MFIFNGKICKLLVVWLAVAVCALIAGCDAGSNGPISTELSNGAGYKIALGSSAEIISVSADTVITAVIYEPDGSPIRDGEEVFFASSEEGEFADSPVNTKNGTAITTYKAGDAPMKYHTITVSCRGAVASINVMVTPSNY
ncbi:MAG: hypothetical protein PHV05_02940 [Candidatus Riflebacteria bacterium]|nr:hypothetical protein [Candidatus Riflebacteria bacterium]